MGNIAPRWIQIASRCGNIGPTQFQTERERERDRDRDRERERGEGERERETGPSPTQTQVGRRPAVRRKPLNPGAGQEARGMPGGPSVVTEGYRGSRPLPPTLATKNGRTPGHFRFTDAPVIYSVSCV